MFKQKWQIIYTRRMISGNTTFLWNNTQGGLIKIERGKVKNTRENAYSPTGDIFLRDTAYFIVIQWSIRSYIIESQWNMPYPVWNTSRTGVHILPIKEWNVCVIKLVKYWRFLYNCMYLAWGLGKSGILTRHDFLATPPFTETILQGA